MYAAEILNGGGSPDRKGFAHAAPVFEEELQKTFCGSHAVCR